MHNRIQQYNAAFVIDLKRKKNAVNNNVVIKKYTAVIINAS
jgi:hypothetical protein